MDGEHVASELGRLGENTRNMGARISDMGELLDEIDRKLDAHVKAEEERLRKIEHQLSFAGALFFFTKALVLTVAAVLAFKFGDITALWKLGGK